MSTASIRTFLKQIEDGKIIHLRHVVYNKIKQCPSISTKSLIDQFGAHQSVTAVLSHLESDGLLRKSGTIVIDGRIFSQWVAHTDPDAIDFCRELIDQQKRSKWIKRAQNNGWIDDQVASFLTGLILHR